MSLASFRESEQKKARSTPGRCPSHSYLYCKNSKDDCLRHCFIARFHKCERVQKVEGVGGFFFRSKLTFSLSSSPRKFCPTPLLFPNIFAFFFQFSQRQATLCVCPRRLFSFPFSFPWKKTSLFCMCSRIFFSFQCPRKIEGESRVCSFSALCGEILAAEMSIPPIDKTRKGV